MTHDVLIVGGGLSGLMAAHTLCCELEHNVLILEARHQLGGCVNTFNTTTHYPIDMGVKFIDTTKTEADPNPLLTLIEQLNIKTIPIDPNDSITYGPTGEPEIFSTNPDIMQEIKAITMLVQENKTLLAEGIKTNPQYVPPTLGQILHFQDKSQKKPGTPEYIAEQYITAMITHNTGASIHDVSLLELLKEDEFPHKNALIEGGMKTLIDALYQKIMNSQKLQVELNTVVTEIHHDPNDAVPYVITSNKKEFKAKTILCTIPLGVLKEGDVQFYPPLSQEKQKAIKNLKPRLQNTVVLEFEKPFWPNVSYIYTRNSPIREYLNMNRISGGKAIALVCHCRGEDANFQHKTKKQITDFFSSPLKVFKGFKPPILSHLSHWDRDRFARGRQYYCAKGSSALDLQNIVTPEKHGLYFTGGVRGALDLHAHLANMKLSRTPRRRPY